MAKVTGKFAVQLRTPIVVSPNLNRETSLDALIDIDGNRIRLLPREYKPAEIIDVGSTSEILEEAELLSLTVWVTKEVRLAGSASKQDIPKHEVRKFEPLINEAMTRFVLAIKRKTNQANLDHRLPFTHYSPLAFFSADESLQEELLSSEEFRIPTEANTIRPVSWGPSDFAAELTAEIWQQVTDEVQQPVELTFYHEALFDARQLYSNRQFTAAFAFATFAAESVIKELSRRHLQASGGFTQQQTDDLLYDARMPRLIKFAESAYGITLPKFGHQKLQKMFDLRNKVAHGKEFSVSNSQALRAIEAAEALTELAKVS